MALQPRGPLPARVYWTRRLVLIGLVVVLVFGLARLLGTSSDGSSDTDGTATTVGAATAPSETAIEPTVEPTRRRKNKGKRARPPAPVLAEPTGPCASSDIVVTPAIASADGGSDVPITFNLRTQETPACTWSVNSETLTVSITSGKDSIWSSRECPTSITAQDVVVRQAVDTPVVVTWDARRSDETCSKVTEWAMPGFYHVEAAAFAGEPTDLQFELTRPASAVITKTVTPKPKKTKKSKTKSANSKPRTSPAAAPKKADTDHKPGEQGAGNSEG